MSHFNVKFSPSSVPPIYISIKSGPLIPGLTVHQSTPRAAGLSIAVPALCWHLVTFPPKNRWPVKGPLYASIDLDL